MSEEHEFPAAALETAFADPPPPTSVNAERLLERGRRLLRRRRAARSLSAAAAVAVAALLVTALPGARQAQPGSTGGASMISPGRFGWLPKAPDAYQYNYGTNYSMITAAWSDGTRGAGPMLTLLPAGGSQVQPSVSVSPDEPGVSDAGDHPIQVGTIDGNPVWYYSYFALLQHFPTEQSLVWRTASGYWAMLTDNQAGVDGPTLLHVAATADTTPTPVKVPLALTGELAGFRAHDVGLVQTLDDSGLEYIVDGRVGTENVSIIGIAGNTGLTRRNGVKCDFVQISGLGTYPQQCRDVNTYRPGDLFGVPAPSSAPILPSASAGSSSPAPTASDPDPLRSLGAVTPLRAALRVVNGIDVYVSADVNEQYSQSLSENAVTHVTSFGLNPADWQVEGYAA